MAHDVDVLIPTYRRPAALAATLASLVGQTHRSFRVVVSDQTEDTDVAGGAAAAADAGEVRAAARVLRLTGRPVELHRHLPRRGLAEHRQSLLDRVTAPACLYLDDDVILEPDVLARLLAALRRERCGFVGAFPSSPSGVDSRLPVDEPPPGVAFELWEGPVRPEVVEPGGRGWDRRLLHFAAYPVRVAMRDGLAAGSRDGDRLYKVAWVGACVLYDTARLRAVGGFDYWPALPEAHVGEDVLTQLRVMRRYGGAALVRSGAWHQEVPTTLPAREVDAPLVLGLDE